MSFKTTFASWLDESLPNEIPHGVVAFSFNLTEITHGEFEVEIIGAESFDAEDEDWACDEVWEPSQRSIEIPEGEIGNQWEEVLDSMTSIVMDYLDNGSKSGMLKSGKGIGIGFVSGDLNILWKAD